MTLPFRVESSDINDLTDLQLTKLLDLLLRLEARAFGIAEKAVEVALNIRVPDGGEDGRIQWHGGPDSTDFIPQRFTQFQNKATDIGPTKCANELVTSGGEVKPMVEEALTNGAAYVLFTTQEQNQDQKTANVAAMRKRLEDLGKAYAQTANIQVYDASKIAGWVNRYLSAIVAVLNWVGRPLERGLKTWADWGQHPEYESFPFVADPERRDAIAGLRELLPKTRKCARCMGLSGLGKTRLAFEIFRDRGPTDDLSKRVVYVDSSANLNIPGLVTDWVQCGIEGIFVVDNCDISLHDRLRREVQRLDSKLSLLTLDYNVDRAGETEIVHLKPMADEYIKEMLHPVYGEKISDLDRIVTFAQGFPQMAVLLAASRLEKEPEMGRLNDDDLARKLLWGGEQSNGNAEKILRGCALFDKFGLEDEARSEYKFIADRVVGVSFDEFYDCVRRFEQRGLIDRRGRYARIVPKPLAIRLAAEWWKATRPERQVDLIQSDMPEALVISFCDQVSRLDFLPEVKALVTELCGPQGPFGQAEVTLSEKGSRLFRAFVDVNPEATSHALASVLNRISRGEILAIQGRARRNLVWALEKLCFHKECFNESAWSLLLLASAENENWSNNATGQFKQLFRTFLSGTQAVPEQRLTLIDQALADPAVREYAVLALEEVISTRSGTRVVGAEYQGSGEPLREWKPLIWQEAFDYWAEGLRRLVDIVVSRDSFASNAKGVIARSFRGLMGYGRVSELDQTIRQVIAVDGPLWPEAVDSVKSTIEFDSNRMPEEGKRKLAEWLDLLTPSSLPERLALFVTSAPYEHKQDETGHFVDVAAENAQALARELAGDLPALLPYIDRLQVGTQRLAYFFAKWLVQYSGAWEPLLSRSSEIIASNKDGNTSFLLGLLDGLSNVNPPEWLGFVKRIGSENPLAAHFASILTTGKIDDSHLRKVIDFAETKVISVSSVAILSCGGVLDHLPSQVVSDFVLGLLRVSPEAGWYGLDILCMYCHGNEERKAATRPAFKELTLCLPLGDSKAGPRLGTFHWEQAVQGILKDESELAFSLDLARHIVKQNANDVDYSDRIHYVRPVLRTLFTKFGENVWPVFAEVIRDAGAVQKYYLSSLLGSDDGFNEKSPSVLADLPDQVLKNWCFAEPEVAPEFLAGATDVLIETDGAVSMSPRARFLLDTFGDDENVLSALSANLGTFGWAGSLVPYYSRELAVLQPLTDHQKPEVRTWISKRIAYLNKVIERERQHDQEGEWGLY